MSLYGLADLHLSLNSNKSMEIFKGWENYTERIKNNWLRIVSDEDTVVLSGDISWGMSLEESLEDFKFIDSLPGKKIIVKGNHDYWWNTLSKMNKFLKENNLSTVSILHNNCFQTENFAVCGTRGWVYDGSTELDKKVILRERGRLDTSLSAGEKTGKQIKVFLHYPPVYGNYVCEEIMDVLYKHGIKQIYYGHIHGAGRNYAPKGYNGVDMRILSCDCVNFTPIFIG